MWPIVLSLYLCPMPFNGPHPTQSENPGPLYGPQGPTQFDPSTLRARLLLFILSFMLLQPHRTFCSYSSIFILPLPLCFCSLCSLCLEYFFFQISTWLTSLPPLCLCLYATFLGGLPWPFYLKSPSTPMMSYFPCFIILHCINYHLLYIFLFILFILYLPDRM